MEASTMGGFGKRLLIGALVVVAVLMTVGQLGRMFGPPWRDGGPGGWRERYERYEQQGPGYAEREFRGGPGFAEREFRGGPGFAEREFRSGPGFGPGHEFRGRPHGHGHHGFGPGKFWLFGWPTRLALLALLGALLWRAWSTRRTDTPPPPPPGGTQTV
jgi:hypothetical protein